MLRNMLGGAVGDRVLTFLTWLHLNGSWVSLTRRVPIFDIWTNVCTLVFGFLAFLNSIQIRKLHVLHTCSQWTSPINDIDTFVLDRKGFLGRNVSSKGKAREVNPRLKTNVYAYMFRRNADNVWHEAGQLCTRKRQTDLKSMRFSVFRKMNVSLLRYVGLASKPFVLQHFGVPPFSSINSKYCKGCKSQNKRRLQNVQEASGRSGTRLHLGVVSFGM